MNKKHIKVMAIVFVLMLAISMLAGCGGNSTPKPQSTTPPTTNVEIKNPPIGIDFKTFKDKTFLRMDKAPWASDTQYYDIWDKDFMEKFGAKARDTGRPSPGETEKLALLVATGDAPALVSANQGEYPMWPAKGLLQPINKWLNPADNTFSKLVMDNMAVRGDKYFMQADDYAPPYGIVYNYTQMVASGLELPRELAKKGQWTYDKMREYARAFNVDENNDGTREKYGYETGWWGDWFAVNDASFYEIDPKTQDCTLTIDSEKAMETWNFLKEGVQSKDFKWGWDGMLDMENGKDVMSFTGMNYAWDEVGWGSRELAKKQNFKYDWAPAPRSPSNVASANPHDNYVPFVWCRAVGQNARNPEIGFAWYWYYMNQKDNILINGKAQPTREQKLARMNPVQKELHLWYNDIKSKWPSKFNNFTGCPNLGWEVMVNSGVVKGESFATLLETNKPKMIKALADLSTILKNGTPDQVKPNQPVLPELVTFDNGSLLPFTPAYMQQAVVVDAVSPLKGKALQCVVAGQPNSFAPVVEILPANKFKFTALNMYKVSFKYKVVDGFNRMKFKGFQVSFVGNNGTQENDSWLTYKTTGALDKESGTVELTEFTYSDQSYEKTVRLVLGVFFPCTVQIDDFKVEPMTAIVS